MLELQLAKEDIANLQEEAKFKDEAIQAKDEAFLEK